MSFNLELFFFSSVYYSIILQLGLHPVTSSLLIS